MSDPMTVRVEVWPVAADPDSLWLTPGGPLRPPLPIAADSTPHAEVGLALAHAGLDADVQVVHSTSWRADGPSIVLTYLAVVRRPGPAAGHWPDATPITPDWVEDYGPPPTHAPTDAPTPRRLDPLIHALRHLLFLLNTDATTAVQLDQHWRRHLRALSPALAGMYDKVHPRAATTNSARPGKIG